MSSAEILDHCRGIGHEWGRLLHCPEAKGFVRNSVLAIQDG